MFKNIFYGVVIFLCVESFAWAQNTQVPQPSDELIGDWQLLQTYCSDIKTQRLETTRIMKVPWLGFEPHVQLRVFETASGKNVEKIVPKSSCESSQVDTTHFIRSTYAIDTRTYLANDQKIHTVTSKGITSKNVN